MNWRISRGALDAITAEAGASPDSEVCGLLFGRPGLIETARSCRNVAADPGCGFELDPAALVLAMREEREGGPAIVGSYHSHPNGRQDPSARDVDAAVRGLFLIVAGGTVTAWTLRDGNTAEPVTLSALSAESASAKDGAAGGM